MKFLTSISTYLLPANEVCKGYVFTSICQSFCSQGGISSEGGVAKEGDVHGKGGGMCGKWVRMERGRACQGVCAWQTEGMCIPGGMCGRGCACQGGMHCKEGVHATETTTEALSMECILVVTWSLIVNFTNYMLTTLLSMIAILDVQSSTRTLFYMLFDKKTNSLIRTPFFAIITSNDSDRFW